MVKSILLIDDDFATNYLHQLMLEQLKMVKNIFIVDNGKQALDILFDKQNKPKLVPDLILLDLNMPLMDGWSFINEYKKYVPATKSNIIMITSSLNPKDQEKCQSNPYIKEIIVKPIEKKTLLRLLNTV